MAHASVQRQSGTLSVLTATGGLVLLDQVTKIAAVEALAGIAIPPKNSGYAFGIVGGSPTAFVIGAIAVFSLFVAMIGPLATRFGISAGIPALIAGGMLGNTIDRIRLGGVRDFIVTPWAIINVADLCVIAGLVGLVVALLSQARSFRRAAVRTAGLPASSRMRSG